MKKWFKDREWEFDFLGANWYVGFDPLLVFSLGLGLNARAKQVVLLVPCLAIIVGVK